MNAKKIRVFVDMDGTIADLYSIKNYLTEMYKEDFFYSLPAYRNTLEAIILFKLKHPEIPCSTLSSAMSENPGTVPGKNYWLDRNIPADVRFERIFTEYGKPKADFIKGGISSNDYLLDDHSPNLIQWENAGGTGIKVINQINGSGIKWKKQSISYLDPPQETVAKIERIVLFNAPS